MVNQSISITISPEIIQGSEKVLKKIGMSVSDYVNLSLKYLIFEEKIPFDAHLTDPRMPENMRIENKEQLIRLLDEGIEDDDNAYHTIDYVLDELGISKGIL